MNKLDGKFIDCKENIKIIPKNHNERFNLLEKYFPKI
jgi:hypothetical protein